MTVSANQGFVDTFCFFIALCSIFSFVMWQLDGRIYDFIVDLKKKIIMNFLT